MENLLDCLNILSRLENQQKDQLYTIDGIVKKALDNALANFHDEDALHEYDCHCSDSVFDNFEILLSILLKRYASHFLHLTSVKIIPVQQQATVKKALFWFSFSCLNSILSQGIIKLNLPWVFHLWQSRHERALKIKKLLLYLETVGFMAGTNVIAAEMSTYLLPHLLLAVETLREMDPRAEFFRSNSDFLGKYFPKKNIMETMICLLRERKRNSNFEWFFIRLEQRLNGYVVERNGLRTLLNCIDNFGGEKFWQQQSPCDALAALILKVTSRQSGPIMSELRLLVLSQKKPEHYGFLLSSIVEKSKKSKSFQKAVCTQILDRIFFPADVLWVKEFEYEKWVQHFDSSLFLAQSWLLPTRAGYCSEYDHRMRKLLAILIYINGWRDEESIVSLILHLLDGCEKNEEKARLLLETFSLLHRARNFPEVSKEGKVDHFGIISLNSKPDPEIINDIFFDSLVKLVDKLEKSRGIMANLLLKTMVLWNEGFDEKTFVRNLQEVDLNGEESYAWSVLHLMGNLGEWLMNKDDSFEDEDVILGLLGIVKENVRRVDHQILEFSQKQKDLDIRLVFNAPDLLRTTHLSLGLLGGLYGQGESEKIHGLYEECGEILLKLYNTLSENESTIDKDYKNLKLSITNFLKLLGKELIKTSSDKHNLSEYDRLMEIMENEFEDEEDGNVEIAERGGAIIKMTSLIRRRDSCLVEDCPRLFDVLFHNIHHLDSYVYLSAINSLSHLVLWKHSQFLSKIIFLFLNWECFCEDNDSKNCDICNRNQIQLGEAISRILLELGEISAVYYGQLNTVFTAMLNHQSDIVVSSSLSAFSNLIQVSKGKFLWKNFFELLYVCNELLSSKRDKLLRRASVFLLRTMLTAQETFSLLRSNKEANAKLIQVLKQTRATDSDDVVRFHADLALSDVKELLKQQLVSDSIEKNTRVLYL